ncbi:MAG TPA: nickel-responsive transcriptional regulator NikR [Acidobacteriota bacterium]
MPQVQRFGVSIPTPLLDKFDRLLERKGYQNRSEALRDLVRDYLVTEEAEKQKGIVLGTVTLVYDHDITNLSDRLTELQHKYHAAIVSSLHIHLSRTLCMEVVIVQGRYGKVKEVADHLISLKGVRHGKLVFTPKNPAADR